VERVDGDPSDGDIVDVYDSGRNWLARGYINQQSQITVRLLTWHQDEVIDADFWRRRLQRAIDTRAALGIGEDARPAFPGANPPRPTNAYRLVHAESDYLPGLIVDRYDEWLVAQFLTLGMDQRRDEIIQPLVDLLEPRGVYERSDVDVRKLEGMEERAGLLWGEEPPQRIEVLEGQLRFLVDVRRGHKTGFYLDQRQNRGQLTTFCEGAQVLDAFAYTGAFACCAGVGGATAITLIDTSGPALDLARENVALNLGGNSAIAGLATDAIRVPSTPSPPQVEVIEGDVFSVLRAYRADQRFFDVIILDPPKLAHTQAQVQRAARAYKDVNLLALQLLRSGGLLFTFSCSGRVSADLFQKIVFAAAVDAGRQGQVVGRLTQSPDHPVALTFPQGSYLKGLMLRVR
jgi:23S rRNA (cytosine1962-C5)-methyltransferase